MEEAVSTLHGDLLMFSKDSVSNIPSGMSTNQLMSTLQILNLQIHFNLDSCCQCEHFHLGTDIWTWKRNVAFARFELGLDVSVPQPLKGSNWDAYAICSVPNRQRKEQTDGHSWMLSSPQELKRLLKFHTSRHRRHPQLNYHFNYTPAYTQPTYALQLLCNTLLVEGLDPWGYDRPKLVFWDFFVQVDDQFWTKFPTMHRQHWPCKLTTSTISPIVCMAYMHKAALRCGS